MTGKFEPNEAQRRAIEFGIDTPLKVVAGAGTGKTAVLTHRFVHIVKKHHIPPHRILALTFTKKAAAEMQERITRELLDRELISRSEAALLLWIGNFHSVCLKLLKQSALMLGLDPSFNVANEAEQRLVLAEVVTEFLNKKLNSDADPGHFENLMIDRFDEFLHNVLTVINRLKDHFITVENLKRDLNATLSEQYRVLEVILNETIANESSHINTRKKAERRLALCAGVQEHERLLVDAIYEIYRAYQEKLEKNDLLDFSDIIYHAHRLVQLDPSVKNRFDYILVDEFQDTDYGQYRLLEALSRDFSNVTVVCDRKQSIYEWREARPENIDGFPGDTISLYENYRSFGEILDSANYFIAEPMPDECALEPAVEGGRGRAHNPRVKLFRADDQEAEAEYVALEIGNLLGTEEYKPSEIVVLMRSVQASRPYEDALRALGIQYATVGGCGFYDISEIKDLLALLRLISNPFDDLSMVRILQSAVTGLSDATLHKLCKRKNEFASNIYDVLKNARELIEGFRPETRCRLQRMVDVIDRLANGRWSLTMGELISEVLNHTGYLKYLSSKEGPRGARFSNVARLYKMATSFEEGRLGSELEEFLSYTDNAIYGDFGAPPANPDAIQIMTVHQAKGLEFPVVFVVNLRSGAFPLRFRQNSFGYDEKFGLFSRKPPEGGPSARYEGGYGTGIEETLRNRRYLEENRVMYVAMTRARELLYLATSDSKNEKPGDFFQRIEKFASESEGRCAEIIGVSGSPPIKLSKTEPESTPGMSLEEVKRMATEAMDRITRLSSFEKPSCGIFGAVGLSYSRLSIFRLCPMKYALRYVYDLPLAPYEESRDERHSHDIASAFVLGNLLHKALMQYHRRKKAGFSVDAYEIFAELARISGCPGEILRAGNTMMKRYLDGSLSRMETIYEEKEFHWRIVDDSVQVMFEGKVDRIHRQGDLLKVVDYKTGLHDNESHRLQLGIYRLAMQSVLGERDILTSNFYLSTGEEVERRFSEDELRAIRDGIIEDARKIASGSFEVGDRGKHETRDCSVCGYISYCPSRRAEPSN